MLFILSTRDFVSNLYFTKSSFEIVPETVDFEILFLSISAVISPVSRIAKTYP